MARLEEPDWELFSHAVTSALAVRSREQFYLWLQGAVHGLLPHQILICGVRNPTGSTMLTRHFSSSRYFRQEHFDALVDPGGGLLRCVTPMLNGQGDGIVLCSCADLAADPDALSELIATNELKNAAIKVLAGLAGQVEAYYCFARVSSELDDRLRAVIELITPHLHSAYIRVLARELQTAAADPALAPSAITRRQAQILALVKDGLTNAEIAELLDCSQWTIKNHIQNILRRLGTRSRSQALMRAMRLGLLPPD